MIVLALSVVVGIIGLWRSYPRAVSPSPGAASVRRMALPLPDKPSIAVLPFENMTGDPKADRAIPGKHLGSENCGRDMKDIFALQDEINLKIVTALQVNQTAGSRPRKRSHSARSMPKPACGRA